MKTLLKKLGACDDAMTWAETLNWEWPRIYAECGRGDWLLWLFTRTNPDDVRLRVLAAARCAETVRHLMTDKRSIDALDAAISFGLGQISEDELKPFVDAARNAAWAEAAAWTAAWATGAARAAARAEAAAWAAAEADDAAKVENQQKTADIVRSLISIEKFNIATPETTQTCNHPGKPGECSNSEPKTESCIQLSLDETKFKDVIVSHTITINRDSSKYQTGFDYIEFVMSAYNDGEKSLYLDFFIDGESVETWDNANFILMHLKWILDMKWSHYRKKLYQSRDVEELDLKKSDYKLLKKIAKAAIAMNWIDPKKDFDTKNY